MSCTASPPPLKSAAHRIPTVTVRGPFISTVATFPLELSAPVNPANVVPIAGTDAMVTVLPLANCAVQVPGQLIPAGEVVDTIVPDPKCTTVSGNDVAVNVAVTLRATLIVVPQAPVPEHAPLHPVNAEFGPGVAVSVTGVLSA